MRRKDFGTLKLERNVARAPIFAPRAGVSVQLALAWPQARFHGDTFLIHTLGGVLGPADLLVFTHLCTRYLAGRPSDRRLEVSLGDVGRWLGWRVIGGEQRRAAAACLARLLAATFTSRLRSGGKATERYVEGWHLIDRWIVPEGGRHVGSLWLSATMTALLDAGSVVLLDAATLEQLLRRSPVAARLWVYLEAETLTAERPQRYALFGSRPGEPARERVMAPVADMLRLTDKQRRQTVLRVGRACVAIIELDARYELHVERAREPAMWNLVAARHRTPVPLGTRAGWATDAGDLGNATRATWATEKGDLGNATPTGDTPTTAGSVLTTRATWATPPVAPDGLLQTGLSDGPLQTVPAPSRRSRWRTKGSSDRSTAARDESAAIKRDLAILDDPDAPSWKRDAARAHLAQLGVREEALP